MKAIHTAEFFEKYGSHYDKNKRDVIFPEEMLANKLSVLKDLKLDDNQLNNVTKVFAKQVADELTKKLLEDKKLYVGVLNRTVNLGYTTENQEISARSDIVTFFEYNCFKLAKFKRKYGIV